MVLVLGKVWMIMPFLKKFLGPKKGDGYQFLCSFFHMRSLYMLYMDISMYSILSQEKE